MAEIIDNAGKLSNDSHDLGEFKNVYDAMNKYPNGGRQGDYITILGVKHYWNEENLSWGILENVDESIIQMVEDMLNRFMNDGYAPKWIIFVFKESAEKPDLPIGINKLPEGWVKEPDTSEGIWWTSIGLVDGLSGEVVSWSVPVRFTGKPANEHILIFKQWPTQPESPTSESILPEGWETSPTSSNGMWWMCKGDYDGSNKIVKKWSFPVRVTGLDGNVPTWYVFVFKRSDAQPSIPTGVSTTPTGWVDNPTSDGIWWMSMGTVDGNTNNVVSWSTPVKCTGEDGVDGVYLDFKYALGSMSIAPSYTSSNVNPGSNWQDAPPMPTNSNPGLWMIQARKMANGNLDGTWSAPVRINGEDGKSGQDGQNGGQGPVGPAGPQGPAGTPGVNGTNGAKGQVVYPAGIYSTTVTYTTDANKAPYVLDSSNNTYYVLNKQMTWLGTSQGNKTPYQDYVTNGPNASWIPFSGFEAVFTKLLMASNSLIGSAVFNGEYMFSQQGRDANGGVSSNYQDFGTANFTPNMLFNLKTGKMKLNSDDLSLELDPQMSGISIKDKDGNVVARFGRTDKGGGLSIYGDNQFSDHLLGLAPGELYLNGETLYDRINGETRITPNRISLGNTASSYIMLHGGKFYLRALEWPDSSSPALESGSVYKDSNNFLKVL